MVDINGDGLLDRVRLGIDNQVRQTWVQYNQVTPVVDPVSGDVTNSATRPHLLVALQNGLGGVHSMRYRPSTRFDNTGGDGIPDLPQILWTVSDVRRTDGLCPLEEGVDPFSLANLCIAQGHERVQGFTYEGGRFDAAARQFLGFRRVYEVQRNDLNGFRRDNAVMTKFAQSLALRGKVIQVARYAGNPASYPPTASKLVQVDDSFWSTWLQPQGHTVIYQSQHSMQRYDLSHPATPYATVTRFSVDPYGNNVETLLTPLDGNGWIHTLVDYAVPTAGSHVLDKPSHLQSEYLAPDSPLPPAKFAEKWFYYDDSASVGDVHKGNVTHVRSLVDGAGAMVNSYTTYDAFGNVTVVEDERVNHIWTDYDTSHLHPIAQRNELQHTTQTVTDYRWGKPSSVTDPNGATTQYVYDGAGRPLCVFRPGETVADPVANCPLSGSTTASAWYKYTYADGTPGHRYSSVEVHRKEPNRSDGYLPAVEHFDGLARHRYTESSRVVDCEASATTVISDETEYDPGGRVARRYLPYPGPLGVRSNGATQTDYHLNGDGAYIDPLDRPYRVTKVDGAIVTTLYDRDTTSTIDEAGNKSAVKIDAYGQTVRTEVYEGQSTLYAWSDMKYDGAGRLLSTTMNGNPHTEATNTYDMLGRKVEAKDSDSGTWTYQYDSTGNLVFQNDPNENQSIELCYDALNRITRKYYRSGTAPTPNICASPPDVEYAYDAFDSSNKGIGRLTHVRDLSGETDTKYDLRGRTTSVKKTIAPDAADPRTTYATATFEYDAADRVTVTHYPGGEVVNSVYDESGGPRQMHNAQNESIVSSMCADLFGRTIRIEHGNGVIDTLTYQGNTGNPSAFRLSNISVQWNQLSYKYLDLSYADYDPRGLLGRLTDSTPYHPPGLSNQLDTLEYDHLRRVTTAIGTNVNETYSYSPDGNILTKGNRTFTYKTDKPHQIDTVSVDGGPPQSVEYWDNGTRKSKDDTAQDYLYDHEDRLTQIQAGTEAIRFVYDYQGQQTMRIITGQVGGVTRYYSGLAETATDGSYMRYYYLGGIRVASRRSTDVSWEQVAALNSPVRFAASPISQPKLVVLLGRTAQTVAFVLFLSVASVLAFAPWRSRRVVGVRVRQGHAVGVALAIFLGTLPWPLMLAPVPAEAGGGGGAPLRHWHLDHLGSTQVITDSTGLIVEQLRYTPYGEVRGPWGAASESITRPAGIRREFTGYETETISGLQYAGARFYDPVYGSFLTPDPAHQFASPYTYTNWNPLNVTDPNGAVAEWIIPAFIGAIAAASIIANAIQVGIKAGDVGAAFKSLGISLGIAAATVGLGSVVSFVTTGLGPGIQASIAVAGVGSGVYGVYDSAARGNYVATAFSALTVLLSAYGLYRRGATQGASGQAGGLSQPEQLDFAAREYGQQFRYPSFAQRVSNGITYAGRVLATDLYAGIVGQAGEVWTFGQDLYTVGTNLVNGNFVGAGKGLLSTVFDLLVPNYGYYGGAGWGTRQFGTDASPTPLNRTDWGSFAHDRCGRHLGWVRDVWAGSGLPPGPIGLAYNTLGTPFFSAAGGLQRLGILP